MLERPDLDETLIVRCLREAYGLQAVQVAFLPLGADTGTAVFRVVAHDQTAYFLKLRSGAFDPNSVTLPRLLYDRGVEQIIPPLPTRSGQLWAALPARRQLADHRPGPDLHR